MPNILFASNSISHFTGTLPKSEEWSFDSKRVPYSLGTPANTQVSSPKFPASESGVTWFHFRHGATSGTIWKDNEICRILDKDGKILIQFSLYSGEYTDYRCIFNAGGQSINKTQRIPWQASQMRTFDIKWACSDLLAEMAIYVNEMLLYTHSLSVTAKQYPRFLVLGGSDKEARFSEIIIADGDTRNARLDLLRPIAAGAYGNWNGQLSSLADDDPTTGMTTTLPDQFQSTILTPYTGAYNISNVVQVTTTVRGINSPENLEHFIRMSGIDYPSDSFVIPFEKDYQVTDWKLNPATSAPWDADDLTGTEFGFKSLA